MKKIKVIAGSIILFLAIVIVTLSILLEIQNNNDGKEMIINIRNILNYIYPLFVIVAVSFSVLIFTTWYRGNDNKNNRNE